MSDWEDRIKGAMDRLDQQEAEAKPEADAAKAVAGDRLNRWYALRKEVGEVITHLNLILSGSGRHVEFDQVRKPDSIAIAVGGKGKSLLIPFELDDVPEGELAEYVREQVAEYIEGLV